MNNNTWNSVDKESRNETLESRTELVPAKSDNNELASHSANMPLSRQEIDRLPTSLAKVRTKRDEVTMLLEAHKERLKYSINAQLTYDKDRIKQDLTKALEHNRAELFSFLETMGIQQLQRRHEIAIKLEEIAKNWLAGVIERDMPEFMREMQVDAIKTLWIKKFRELMEDQPVE